MAEHDQYLEVRPGDTLPIDLTITDSDGNAVPLTDLQGEDLKFTLSRAGVTVLTKIIGDGIEVTDAAKGEVTITLGAADTGELAGAYDWVVVLTTSGEQVYSVADGSLVAFGAEPVALAEAKLYCKVEVDDDDALISDLIATARQYAEDHTRTSILLQARTLSFDRDELFEYGPYIELQGPPIVSITSIKSYDDDDVESTMSSSAYRLSGDRIVLASGGAWPAELRRYRCLEVVYRAGYATPSEVPSGIRTAIKRIVQDLYDNRGDQLTGTISASVELTAKRLLDPYRVYRL